MTLPKTPGTCADHAYKLQMENRELNRKIEENKKRIAELNNQAKALLKKANLTEAAGKSGRIAIESKWVFSWEDKVAFRNFAWENDELDLLDIRMSAKALEQRAEEGIKVPGVNYNTIEVAKLRKA